MSFVIPGKLQGYIRRLCLSYKAENPNLSGLLASAPIYVNEGVSYDNYDGGTYGHNVIIFFPDEFFERHPLKDQEKLKSRLLDDLRTVASSVPNEFVYGISFDLADENDPEFQKALAAGASPEPPLSTLPFWHNDYVRLFISHRDKHKRHAHELRSELEQFGISSFVAHDTIRPMATWQGEILKALQTMEVFLCFITDDFDASVWTNQEIGYAMGRRTPIISFKLETKDPPGFIGAEQALRGTLKHVKSSVDAILDLISNKVGQGERIKKATLEAFSQSKSFADAELKFDRMVSVVKKINDDELDFIVRSFNANTQLNSAYYLTRGNRFINYLARASGKNFAISNGELAKLAPPDLDEIPF